MGHLRVLQFCGTWEGEKLEAVAEGISPPGSVVCLSVVGLQHFLSEASVSEASHLFSALPYAALQTCAPESLDWHSSRRNSWIRQSRAEPHSRMMGSHREFGIVQKVAN